MQISKGVILTYLKSIPDEQGIFTELDRESWIENTDYTQWNVLNSNSLVFRDFHLHKKHFDYLEIIKGTAILGLHDMRRDSPTFRLSAMVELNESILGSLIIPPGVDNGFYFSEVSTHIKAVSEYWNLEDKLGCLFFEKQLNLDWTDRKQILFLHDMNLSTYEHLQQNSYPI